MTKRRHTLTTELSKPTRDPSRWGGEELVFALDAGDESVRAQGVHRVFQSVPGPEALVGEGDTSSSSAPPVVVGALPFGPEEKPSLVQPVRWTRAHLPWGVGGAPSLPPVRIMTEEDEERYARRVRAALRALELSSASAATLRKVVLARRMSLRASAPLVPAEVFQRLTDDPAAAAFLARLFPVDQGPPRTLVGASPELLVERVGRRVRSAPLAGSAPRAADPAEDRRRGEDLQQSDKDRYEHRLVVEHVAEVLSRFCTDLQVAPEPRLTGTRTLWHLETLIEGALRDGSVTSLELAQALHPTPAVCGVPSAAALELIRRLEPHPRGFYAGAVGWSDSSGDGRWLVSIRCAELSGDTAVLHAGAGIVEGSEPLLEAEETSQKFGTLLSALGLGPAMFAGDGDTGRSVDAAGRSV